MFNMPPLAVVLGFAAGAGAARIQVEEVAAESISLGSQFPSSRMVIITNAVMKHTDQASVSPQCCDENGDTPQLLDAYMDYDDSTPNVHFDYRTWIDYGNTWVIQPHPGQSEVFTICNMFCNCLFAKDDRTVDVYQGTTDEHERPFSRMYGYPQFSPDAIFPHPSRRFPQPSESMTLWRIEPTDSDGQLYTITHADSGLRLYWGGMTGNELGIGDDAFGHRERVWPDQTWYIEDRAEKCQQHHEDQTMGPAPNAAGRACLIFPSSAANRRQSEGGCLPEEVSEWTE